MRENARVKWKRGKIPAGLQIATPTFNFRADNQGVVMLDSILNAFREKFGSRRVEIAMPDGQTALVEHEASDEIAENVAPLSMPMALFIVYADGKGQVSRRRISCKGYDVARDSIKAYCFERKAPRAFKVGRIQEVVAVDTGEVLALTIVVEQLRGKALPVHDERLARVLTILVFLMRCDGHSHPAEREVIEAAASAFALRFDGNDETVDQALVAAFRSAPDADDLILALQWIGARPECLRLVRLLMPLVDQIVTADGVIASQEAFFGGIVLDALKSMGSP